MPSPTYSHGSGGSNATSSITVTLPGTAAVSPVLIVLATEEANVQFSQSAGTTGWTELLDDLGIGVWYKDVSASEANPSFDLSQAEDITYQVWRFTGNVDPWSTKAPSVSATIAQVNQANPPAVTISPSSTGLAIAFTRNNDSRQNATAAPSGYSNLRTVNSSGGPDSTQSATADLYVTPAASSEDPGAFTVDNATWSSCTLFVYEGAALTFTQANFRWRNQDEDVAANANGAGDWDGALNVNASQQIDYITGLRIEVESAAAGTEGFQLFYQKGGAGGYQIVPNCADPWGDTANQFEVMCVAGSYTDGEATTDILSGSPETFRAGSHNDDNTTPTVAFAGAEHTELEWRIVVRKLAADPAGGQLGVHAADGDFFDFRVYRDNGSALDTYSQTPRLTVANRPKHLGGTWPETTNRAFVVDELGNMYCIKEYCHAPLTAVTMAMLKSTDGGDSWNVMDVANEPTGEDLEAIDMDYIEADNTIHIALQGPSGDDVFYHTFRTAGHASADTWGITDEAVDIAATPNSQAVAIAHRDGDGTTVLFYMDNDGTRDRVRYRIRNGTWGAEQTLDSEAGHDIYHPRVVKESDDTLHIFYLVTDQANAEFYHNTLDPVTDALGTRAQVNQAVTMNPSSNSYRGPSGEPRIWDDAGTMRLGIGYVDTLDQFYWNETALSAISWTNEAQINNAGNVERNGLTQHRVVADVAVDDALDDLWAVWPYDSDFDMRSNQRSGGTWGGTDLLRRTGRVQALYALVFTHSAGNGGARVVGVMLEDNIREVDPGGGTGYGEYQEWVLAAADLTLTWESATEVDTAADWSIVGAGAIALTWEAATEVNAAADWTVIGSGAISLAWEAATEVNAAADWAIVAVPVALAWESATEADTAADWAVAGAGAVTLTWESGGEINAAADWLVTGAGAVSLVWESAPETDVAADWAVANVALGRVAALLPAFLATIGAEE